MLYVLQNTYVLYVISMYICIIFTTHSIRLVFFIFLLFTVFGRRYTDAAAGAVYRYVRVQYNGFSITTYYNIMEMGYRLP